MVPQALDNLSPEERHRVYKLLKLRVGMHLDGTLEVSGVLGEVHSVCNSELRSGTFPPPKELDGHRLRLTVGAYRGEPGDSFLPQPSFGASPGLGRGIEHGSPLDFSNCLLLRSQPFRPQLPNGLLRLLQDAKTHAAQHVGHFGELDL